MEKNSQNLSSQEISKQIKNSLETLILCRSIYIIKQKFNFYKERIRSLYDKYNIYKGNYKLNTDIKIYQIYKKDFVQVTEEVLKDLNLLIIKYLNPKDIFLTKVVIEEKMKETMPILQEIFKWLLNNNNDDFSFKYYNNVFFNKKIKPFILEGERGFDDENKKENDNEQNINYNNNNNNNDNNFSNNNNDINEKKENLNTNDGGDFRQILVKKTYVKVVEFNRRGYRINEYKSKIEDDEEDTGEVEIETINVDKLPKNNDNIMTNKEMSININNINESIQSQNENDNNENKNNKNEEETKKIEVEEENEIKKTSSIKSTKIKNNDDCLFIESLPLILSDFLEKHISYAVVESEEDLAKELKILFDKDILNRINDYESIVKEKLSIINNINSSIMSSDEKENKDLDNALDDLKKIKDNIKIYQEILENKKKLNENVEYIEKMIEKLLAKEIWLEHRIKLLSEKNNINYNSNSLNNTNNMGKVAGNTGTSDLSYLDNVENKNINANNNKSQFYNNTHSNKQLNESTSNSINTNILNDKSNTTSALANTSKSKINNALQEIFTYYSKQHVLAGYTPLFSNIEQKKSHLDLNEFSKFCIDFRIPIIRQKLVEIFKKSTSNFKTMSFKEFKNSLISLANASHESKKKNITEKINSKKLELNSIEMREKQIKEEKKLKRLLYNSNDNFNSNNNKNNNNSSKKNKSISRSPSAKANLVQQKKNLFNDITNNKINYNNENKKSYQEIIDDFYQFLGLHSKQEYRSKMRGYNMSPIKTNANYDKSFLSNDGNRSRSFKNEENEEVNKNSRKEKELIDKEKKKNLIFKEKVKLFNINNQRLKITMDKKMKKRTYIDLLQEKKEEKNELLLMQQQQENIIKNKLKEKELQKSKEKEHERLIKNSNSYSILKEESKDNDTKNKDTSKDISKISKDITIVEDKHISNNNISVIENKIDEKGQEQLNNNDNENKNNENNNNEDKVTNLARTEVDSDENKKKDKNQIWWDKLENYDINELGLNEEEKEIFINSDNSEENDVISKISNNQKMSGNNSFGGLISENSMQKSSSIADLNKEKNKGPIQLPPIKKLHGKIVEIKSNDINQIIKSQNQKRTGLDEIKNRIMNGNNNNNNINSKQQQDTNNRYKNIYKNKSSAMVKSNPSNINMESQKNKDKNKK